MTAFAALATIVSVLPEPVKSATDPQNAAQGAYWNQQAAASWIALQDRLDKVFEPLTRRAIAAASPRPGERVLDIGCGCGGTVLALAEHVGTGGHVLGVDISEPMSARARQRIAAAGYTNLEIVVADAGNYAFAAGESDLLFSRFGVMFFPDPAAALANLRLAMRPGGRLQWVVWRPLTDNPWFRIPLEAALPVLPPPAPADPFGPGPFAFADPGRVIHLLQAAGWRNPKLIGNEAELALGSDPAAAAELCTWVGPLARRLIEAHATPALHQAACRCVERALRARATADGLALSASVWLVSAET
ncbi:MAG: methyltransferase domain-containing protein [Acetobacteraceae bacterium]|nr:methyltransferase domain-containing protein [Acetobacteraceae bacterium]